MIKLIIINNNNILNKKIGDTINTNNGFAYNYLIPYKIAIEYNENNKLNIENFKNNIIKQKINIKEKENEIIDKINSIKILYFYRNICKNNNIDKYITSKEILELINKNINIKIKNKNIYLKKTIKKIGEYSIYIKRNNIRFVIKIIVKKL